MRLYFGVLAPVHPTAVTLPIILVFSVIAWREATAWRGSAFRVNTFANSRTAFAALRGKPYPIYPHAAGSRNEHRHDADQRRSLLMMLFICFFIPGIMRALLHRLCDW